MARSTQDQTAALVKVERLVASPDDVVLLVEQVRRAVFGALAIAAEVLARSVAESVPASAVERQRIAGSAGRAADSVLGVGWWVTHSSSRAVVSGVRRAAPAIGVLAEPPLLPSWLSARRGLRRMALTWAAERPDSVRTFVGLGTTVAHTAADMVGPLVSLDAVLDRVLDHVDLDGLVEVVLSDLDLNRLVSRAIAEVDLAQIVEQSLDRVDTTRMVLDHVDIVAVAQAVIDGVDLPAIVRQSSGSIASETVDTVRLQGIDADRAVARLVDRLLLRRTPGLR